VRVLGTPDDLVSVAGQQDVDLVVLALPASHAQLSEQVRARCETLGVPAFAAGTFVEMHFAGLPVLPSPEAAPPELTDPDASTRR
jgi:hypothetical protein